MSTGAIIAIVLASLVFIFALVLFILMPKKIYFTALFSKAYIPVFKSISMKLRNENMEQIVNAYILAKKSHNKISLYELELISTSGGNALKVVEGLNAAQNAKLPIDLEFAKAVDIAGMDIVGVVRECINTKYNKAD